MPANAHLGGDAASVFADAQALRGVVYSTELLNYGFREITSADGVRVREFSTLAGVVFALSWSGPVPPDLQQLLGEHFTTYAAAIAQLDHAGLHRAVRVATPTLVLELTGHPRAYSGHAYLPALVPPGLEVATLR